MQKDDFEVKWYPGLPRFGEGGAPGRSLRVCIATEEIFGPVRNGGIASTYYHLARTLANDGHQVTVLYLKGRKCENETVEHWVAFYRGLGVRFVPLPAGPVELVCPSPRWQRQMYEFLQWLKGEEPYDVVHASEWRGGVYYALLAKRLGLAFERTLFVMKTSSPWIWNRHYRMLPLGDKSELGRMYPERRVVELADLVIGGSAHLLTFMERKGYRLPAGRTFVQPNIIDFQDLKVEERRPRYEYGDRVRTGDLVFFGRLEARKGLDIFCDALTRLVERGVTPRRVTFLGKEGEKLSSPRVSPIRFIEEQARGWPFPVEVIDFYDQDRAIGYLCASPRIAVMPSVIENSTMTVYECLVHRVPFLATRVGGTPELIGEAYRDRVLARAHPESLAASLEEVLREGGTVAEGAFVYRENLEAWRDFHRCVGVALATRPVDEVVAEIAARHGEEGGNAALAPERAGGAAVGEGSVSAGTVDGPRVSACVYFRQSPRHLNVLLDSLVGQDDGVDEVVVMFDGPGSEEALTVVKRAEARSSSTRWTMLDQPHRCLGPALNAAAARATGDLLVFLNTERHCCEPNLVGVLRRAAAKAPAAAFTCFHAPFEGERPDEGEGSVRVVPLGGDLASGFFDDGAFGGSCFAVRRSVFRELGGFLEGYHLDGIEQEFHARLVLAGHGLDVVPEVLYRERAARQPALFDARNKEYVAVRPFLESAPPYLENLLLTARTLARKAERPRGRAGVHRSMVAGARAGSVAERNESFLGFLRGVYRWSEQRAHRGSRGATGGVVALARHALQSAPYHLANVILAARTLARRAEYAGLGIRYRDGALTVSRVESGARWPGAIMALARRRSRFGLPLLEIDVRLDPEWIERARRQRARDPAIDLRCNGRVSARVFVRDGPSDFLRIRLRTRPFALGEVLYSIHDASTGETLAALLAPGRWRARRIEGAVESCSRLEVRGWVVDPELRGRGRTIVIHLDGSPGEVLIADASRDGPETAKGNGRGHGFRWAIPATVGEREGTRIDVFDAETGRPLRGSPVRVEGGRVVASGS